MSVNRRNFLKLLSAATVGLISDPLSTVIAHNHIYVNKHLGIAFKAPIDWHFYTTHSIKRMHDAQIMRADRAEIEDLVHELKNQPLVALGRDPSDPQKNIISRTLGNSQSMEQSFTPSITIRLELLEDHISLHDIYEQSNLNLSHLLAEYKSINAKIDSLCGYPTLMGKYSYLYEAEGMRSTPIVGRSCVIDVEHYYYSINMYNYDPEEYEISQAFDQFIKSFVIL